MRFRRLDLRYTAPFDCVRFSRDTWSTRSFWIRLDSRLRRRRFTDNQGPDLGRGMQVYKHKMYRCEIEAIVSPPTTSTIMKKL